MSEELIVVITADKKEKYESLLPQISALVSGETNLIANLANISAALRETFGWWWVGFYWVENNELVLGPFQGPIACTRIAFGKGVCGTSWKTAKSIWVKDVNQFPGHIACSSSSVSEIVVPIFDCDGQVVGIMDVDSERYDVLDEIDQHYLAEISKMITVIL